MNEEKECPACELMNAEEADTCRHCGTAFFFELECLTPRLDDPADELVEVASFSNITEASHIKNLLEAHGIRACMPEDMTPQLFGVGCGSLSEAVTVRVAARDFVLAQQILRDNTNE
jgi:hypothetical protein